MSDQIALRVTNIFGLDMQGLPLMNDICVKTDLHDHELLS
jgi:hypothetical protein